MFRKCRTHSSHTTTEAHHELQCLSYQTMTNYANTQLDYPSNDSLIDCKIRTYGILDPSCALGFHVLFKVWQISGLIDLQEASTEFCGY